MNSNKNQFNNAGNAEGYWENIFIAPYTRANAFYKNGKFNGYYEEYCFFRGFKTAIGKMENNIRVGKWDFLGEDGLYSQIIYIL